MPFAYTPITLDQRDEYLDRLARCPQKASDYSFGNLWAWAEEYGLEWSWGRDCVWLRQTLPETRHWAPVGPWDGVDWPNCPRLKAIDRLTRVPEHLARLWERTLGSRVRLVEARGHWDYLYRVQDLVELKGNRYHTKKNHLNAFLKNHAWEYLPLTADCVETVLALQDDWCAWRACDDSPSLSGENNAILRALRDWDRLPGLMGASLNVDGVMVAYTVAEPLDQETLCLHFEKARAEFRGAYQAVNKFFLEREGQGFLRVNREQDLDEPGLREAKLSYHPEAFLTKYTVDVLQG